MNNMNKTQLMLAVVVLAVSASLTQLYASPPSVVVLEQNIKLKLKLTTISHPELSTGTGGEISAQLNTMACRVTTRDVLETLGFSPTAELISRVTAEWKETPAPEPVKTPDADQWRQVVAPPPILVRPAVLRLQFVVRNGNTETDVTDILKGLLPTHEPIGCINECANGQSVAKGVVASQESGFHASLRSMSSGVTALPIRLANLTDQETVLGDLVLACTSLSRSSTSIRVWPSGINLSDKTDSRVMGGAQLNDSLLGLSIPGVIEGSVTARGHSWINTLELADLIDVKALVKVLSNR